MTDGYYGVSEIGTAIEHAKRLLWPPQIGIWMRLAVIALFTAGGSISSPVQYNLSERDIPPGAAEFLMPYLPFILLIVAIVIALGLIFWLIRGVMQFVFVDSLTSGRVLILPYAKNRWRKGLRLFGFEAGLSLLLLLVIGALALILLFPLFAATGMPNAALLPALLLLILFFVVLLIPLSLVLMLTVDFAVPIMIRDDVGVLDAWRRLAPLLRREWQQALVYVAAKVLLAIGAGILMFILILLALLVIALPFLVIGLLLVLALSIPFYTILLILLIPFLILAIPAVLLIRVPFETFFRYYSLQVLGRLDARYRLLPDGGAGAAPAGAANPPAVP
ncbi:MAG: hypothetical protein QMD46_07440 [Methanomicrobiales archaeon]|nr:hypothetical protein [Methanomicrobiales archaeon]MDI6876417.1 hypothetical protein [Methanomicrobiales archaeon]